MELNELRLHSLQLNSVTFLIQEMVANSGYIADEDSHTNIQPVVFESAIGSPNTIDAGLHVRSSVEHSENAPYGFHIFATVRATLTAPHDFSSLERNSQILLTIYQVLFGAVREQLVQLSSRGPFGVVALPLVTVDYEQFAFSEDVLDLAATKGFISGVKETSRSVKKKAKSKKKSQLKAENNKQN